MSAHVVGNHHISAMLVAARKMPYNMGPNYRYGGDAVFFHGNETAIGQKLLDENYRSVNYRYGEEDEAPKFKMILDRQWEPVELIKLCDCYIYQTCETPDFRETEAWAIVQALREFAIGSLPGMDEAPWSYKC